MKGQFVVVTGGEVTFHTPSHTALLSPGVPMVEEMAPDSETVQKASAVLFVDVKGNVYVMKSQFGNAFTGGT